MLVAPYRRILRQLSAVLRPAVAFEFWSTLVFVGCVAPASGWLLNRLVASSGQFAISDHDLLSFFLSIRGAGFLLLALGFALAFWSAEKAGLAAIVVGRERGSKVTVSHALSEQLGRLSALLRLGLLQAAAFIATALPFCLGIWLTYRLLLREWDFYYYLNVRPASWWVALAIAGTLGAAYLLLAAALYVRWLFAVPALVFEGAGPVESLKQSWRRTRGRFLEFGIPLVACWLIVLGASALTTWLITFAASQVIDPAGSSLRVLVPAVVATLALLVVTDLLWIIVAKTVHVMLAAGFYLDDVDRPAAQSAPPSGPRRLSPTRLRLGGLLLAAIVTLTGAGGAAAFIDRVALDGTVEITGHRGTKVRAPENTLSAIRTAIDEGADFAEIDVQTTRDGMVVLLHDADLMRVALVDRRLGDLTHEELRAIDVGSWFAPEFRAERVPTLQEAIDLARGRIKLNIELKFARPDPTLSAKVIEIVRRNDFASECILSSLSVDAVTEARASAPELATGLILIQSVGNPAQMEADFLSISAARVTPGLVRSAHRRGLGIHVWTVNDAENTLAMIAMGVDNIITDEPARIRGWVREWNELSNSERIALALGSFVVGVDRPSPSDL